MSSPLKLRYKVLMFLSSYTPLFLILFLKSSSNALDKVPDFANATISGTISYNMTLYDKLQIVNQHKVEFINYSPILSSVIIITLFAILLSNLVIWLIMFETKNTNNPRDLYVMSVQKMDHVYMEYLICYVIPFLSFNYSSLVDMLSLIIFLFIACVIYINSDLLYVNIFFSVRGYHLFKVGTKDKDEYVVLSKKKQLYLREIIEVRDVSASSERFVLDTQ